MNNGNELFITTLIAGNEKLCKLVLDITENPQKLKKLSKLCEYVYDLGAAESLERYLP
jgi:hypothetical protein